MVAKDMHPMTQVSISALEKALEVAGLVGGSSLTLVDNASVDPFKLSGLRTEISAQIVRFDRNHSFSAASNFGVKKSPSSELILFLNNDVFLHPEAIRTFLADKAKFGASICGARLVYPNGLIQHVGVGFHVGMGGPYHFLHLTPSRLVPRITSYLRSVTGAVMLIDATLFRQLEGFDEIFPFAYEDIDFCLRSAELGAKIICSQLVDSIHLSGQSRNETTITYENFSKEVFQARWGGRVPYTNNESEENI
jgi:GT2 family glycosyltransferase